MLILWDLICFQALREPIEQWTNIRGQHNALVSNGDQELFSQYTVICCTRAKCCVKNPQSPWLSVTESNLMTNVCPEIPECNWQVSVCFCIILPTVCTNVGKPLTLLTAGTYVGKPLTLLTVTAGTYVEKPLTAGTYMSCGETTDSMHIHGETTDSMYICGELLTVGAYGYEPVAVPKGGLGNITPVLAVTVFSLPHCTDQYQTYFNFILGRNSGDKYNCLRHHWHCFV